MAPTRPRTVGELIELLKLFPPDYAVEFNGLTLYRVKDRGDIANFEFNEVFEITHDPTSVKS